MLLTQGILQRKLGIGNFLVPWPKMVAWAYAAVVTTHWSGE